VQRKVDQKNKSGRSIYLTTGTDAHSEFRTPNTKHFINWQNREKNPVGRVESRILTVLDLRCTIYSFSCIFFILLYHAVLNTFPKILPRDAAVLARYMLWHSVCPCVCRKSEFYRNGLVFVHCTALFLSALFVLLFGITASASCAWTHHHGAILLDLQVGTFL